MIETSGEGGSAWLTPPLGGINSSLKERERIQHSAGDQFPMPDVQDVLHRIGGSRLIICFDANSGYWQIPLREESRPVSAFVSDAGLLQFKRVPFGLKSAGNSFIR